MNNNPRIYLWIALALVGWLNYQAWMTDYGPRPGANITANSQTSAATHPAAAPASATAIRERLQEHETAVGLVPPKVLEYIRAHHLYGT